LKSIFNSDASNYAGSLRQIPMFGARMLTYAEACSGVFALLIVSAWMSFMMGSSAPCTNLCFANTALPANFLLTTETSKLDPQLMRRD